MVACGQTKAHWLHWMQLSLVPRRDTVSNGSLFLEGDVVTHRAILKLPLTESGNRKIIAAPDR
jgi:hypothetical protein